MTPKRRTRNPLSNTPLNPLSRIRRIQTPALTLLLISGIVNYLDRATLAIGLPLTRRDLGISVAESGFLPSAFLCAHALFQLPVGGVVDRFGPRQVLSAGLSLWSLAKILCGLCGRYGGRACAREDLQANAPLAREFEDEPRICSENDEVIRRRGRRVILTGSRGPS